MNRDDVIRWAREAGLLTIGTADGSVAVYTWPKGITEELERFAALVAAAERERLHDKFMEIHKSQQHSNNYWHFAARKIKEQE